MAKILAVDDDEAVLALIRNILQKSNHDVALINNTRNRPIKDFQGYDLILLDVMMPDENGFELCQRIRSSIDCPILFLTAKTAEEDIVQGLITGGDDYIAKPFGVMELSARVNAHVRREHRDKQIATMTVSGVSFDFAAKEVWVGENQIHLTKNEYRICELLVKHKDHVYTREQIYEQLYGLEGNALFSTITEFIRVIRKKFKDYELDPISTVWGVGYKWKSE